MFKKIASTVASLALVLALPVAVLAQSYDTSLFDSSSLGSTYDYTSLADQQAAAAAALAGSTIFAGAGIAMIIGSSLMGLVVYIYMGLTLSTVAKKIGVENAWFAWIPILNLILMAKIADINPVMILIMLIPIVGQFYMIYFMVMAYMKMAEKRGLDKYLGLLMLIPVVNFVFMGYLAWGKITPKQVTAAPAA
ncbi:DUF5684 domain-containing protein [Candidatus Dojkabacteria bacterium]|jgi:hypothetical protein|nr:DUF5684 domain-containing protein [Candidatus Dojkabacteria bacterium]